MKTYDGRWWQGLDHDAREQVIDGFLDGSRARGTDLGHIVASAEELSGVYERGPGLLSKPLQSVLLTAGKPASVATSGGEHYAGKHGFYDGDYWFQTSVDGRIGFVEGYLLAASPAHPEEVQHAGLLAERITHWYGFDRDDAPPMAHTALTAIGDVLEKVAPHAK